MKLYFLSFSLVALSFFQHAGAQEHQAATENHAAGPSHKVTLALGHAHVSKELTPGHSEWLTMGAMAFNYDYQFNEKWSVGTHNDLIFETLPFISTKNGELHEEVERSYPVAARLVGAYKPGKHTSFLVGVGEEIAGSKHHFLSTVGLDYGWHLAGGWELGGELTYDFVNHEHDTWVMGVGISKILSLGAHHKAHK